MICGDDLAQILGVEARGERGRADQVAKHHRQLPAFGAISAKGCGHDSRRPSGDLPDRLAAAATEPGGGLILKAAGWAGRRQWRAALGAKAPCRRVFGHAAWAAHLVPRGEPILLKHNSSATAVEPKGLPPGQTSWSKALVRHGADPAEALAGVLGVSVRGHPDEGLHIASALTRSRRQPGTVAGKGAPPPLAELLASLSNCARRRCSAIHASASAAVANGLTVIGWSQGVMTSTENASSAWISQ
jgi:hypothetical protein